MPGKRSRASRNIRPSRTSAVAASTRSRDGAAASAAGVPWRTMPRSAEAAASWSSASATSMSARSRAVVSPGAIRDALWRSLPSALAPYPRSAQVSTIGTIVSRNESESAAWRTSASGSPPSSCTRTSASARAATSAGAPCSASHAATISAQRSWCQRL